VHDYHFVGSFQGYSIYRGEVWSSLGVVESYKKQLLLISMADGVVGKAGVDWFVTRVCQVMLDGNG